MWSNYFKVALRNLLKHKSFSAINIFGLAASMSVCLLVILLIKDAYRFDRFHPESDRVYRVITEAQRKGGGEEGYASSPFPMGKTLTEDYSCVETWTPLVRSLNGSFTAEGKLLDIRGLLTDGAFFQIFGFQLAQGDAATALSEPKTVVLSAETAKKFFGTADPMGKILHNNALGDFKVTGVLEPFPGKTHLEFDALGSLASLKAMETGPDEMAISSNWNNYYMTYNFVRLRKGVPRETAETAMRQIAANAYAKLKLESRDAGYRFYLQPLSGITPGPAFSNSMGKGLPSILLWFLSALGAIVMLSACFNYTNLSIARALTRAKEVGVRKVMGATRGQVFRQFVSEAVVVSGLSLGLAFLLLQGTIPLFNQLQFLESTDVSLQMDGATAGWFLAFALGVGLLAGILPATVLSRFQPLIILQKLQNTKLFRRVGLRKVLIVSQFAVSLVFIITLTVIWRQINFAVRENFGFHDNLVINLDLQGQAYGPITEDLRQSPQIEQISAISHLMGTWRDSKVDVRVQPGDDPIGVRDYFIDQAYLKNMDLPLVAGQDFPYNPTQGRELFAIVNEKFLDQFKLGAPESAVGKSIILEDSTPVSIRGVVKDFLFKPLNYQLEPLLLRYDPSRLAVLNLKVSGNDLPGTLAYLERTWKKFDKSRPVKYEFYDETVRNNFADMYDMAWIVAYFGLLGMLIACMGLLGMAIYSVETRAKEISIRKVIGANARDVVRLLSKGYFLLLVIAAAVAVPIGYLLGQQFLQLFAFQIPMGIMVFLPAIALVFGLGGITIGSQTLRAAISNPVRHLQNE